MIVVVGGDRLNMIARGRSGRGRRRAGNASNVRTVLVAGRFVKRDGALVGVDVPRVRDMLEDSCAGILGRVLDAGPLLPEPRPSFGDLAGPLLANFNV